MYLCGFVNEKIRACSGIYEGASTWQNTPGHSVAKLEKGEQFWVKYYYFSAPIIHEKYTYLSGYRIIGCLKKNMSINYSLQVCWVFFFGFVLVSINFSMQSLASEVALTCALI